MCLSSGAFAAPAGAHNDKHGAALDGEIQVSLNNALTPRYGEIVHRDGDITAVC
jgi:hypothetical protein